MLGDVNNDGVANDLNSLEAYNGGKDDLAISNSAAQVLANSSVSGDARITLASQLIAAQLNEYSAAKANAGTSAAGHEIAPNGLIEDAVAWLTGNNFGTAPAGTDAHANVDTNHNGVLDSGEYSTSGNAFVFTSTPLSSSDPAFQTMQTVLSAANNWDNVNIQASGNGLANVLTAFNQGQLVTSADGSMIGWNNSGTVTDVHANTAGAFWAVALDNHVAGVQHA